jgi:2-polyprenyl-3-methyl-5-hydroxy-6-metoxy-1,4-benzoquinol methylase
MSHNHTWEEAQQEELAFWNSPGADFGEQLKQLTYAKYVKLDFIHDGNSPYVIDKTGLDIMDVGGGPVSLLLKTTANFKIVVDPCKFPQWVEDRYKANNIRFSNKSGEWLAGISKKDLYDEVWLYNVLQHTQDPNKIFFGVHRLLKQGGTFRFLDWIDTPTNVAHPISLDYQKLAEWLAKYYDQPLLQTNINENGAVGTIAYGVFYKK